MDKKIEEILNFDMGKELNLSSMSEEKRNEFMGKLFGQLIERIVKETGKHLEENDQEKIVQMLDEEQNVVEIFDFIAEKNENFAEEAGKEFLDFKTEIYEFLN